LFICGEILARSREVLRDALAALLLFQEAARQETVTAALA
jgi:hypothetical protein